MDTLPPIDTLRARLTAHHQQVTAAQLTEFDQTTRGNWMNYLPSVGIGYTPDGAPRPTTSFSLAQVLTAKRQRQERERQRTAILANAEIELRQLQSQLSAMLQNHQFIKIELETRKQIFEIDRQIFQLAKVQYENAEMSPTEFLPKWKAFLMQQLDIEMKRREVLRLEQEILFLAKYHF